jgi:hypothetical protein
MLLNPAGKPVSAETPATTETRLIGITRSFSYKLNLGDYQSADFFCSQRAECSPDMAQEVSRDLDQFCQDEVREAILQFKRNRAEKISAQKERAA